MPTTRTRAEVKREVASDPRKGALWVSLGATQVVIQRAKGLAGEAITIARRPQTAIDKASRGVTKTYQDLAVRGEKIATSIGRSAYTRRAVEQAKTAASRIRAARTSVRRAGETGATATKEAARKVG